MAIHLLRDLEKLKKELLLVGSLVEDATNKALLSLIDGRVELADEVIEGDREIDDREVLVEEECLKLLALHQPVAADLRFVIAVLKVNNDLERVGDLAGNIASRAKFFSEHPGVVLPEKIREMADLARTMLRESLNALIQLDTDLARKVLRDDESMDERHRHIYSVVQKNMREDSTRVEAQVQLLSVSRYLERIADQATNIAEDVIFMVDGEVVRHRSWH
jgi:phosphate transport system protein